MNPRSWCLPPVYLARRMWMTFESFGFSTLKPRPVVTVTTDLNWPMVSTDQNFFDRVLANGSLEGGVEPAHVNGDAAAGASSALDAWANDEEVCNDIDPEEGGSTLTRASTIGQSPLMMSRMSSRWRTSQYQRLALAKSSIGFAILRWLLITGEKLVTAGREYLLSVSMELERRRVAEEPDNVRRNLELAAYLTQCKLQPPLAQIALGCGVRMSHKANNQAEAARLGDRNPRNAVEILYLRRVHGVRNLRGKLYADIQGLYCSYTNAYLLQFKGRLDPLVQLAEIGAVASHRANTPPFAPCVRGQPTPLTLLSSGAGPNGLSSSPPHPPPFAPGDELYKNSGCSLRLLPLPGSAPAPAPLTVSASALLRDLFGNEIGMLTMSCRGA
ncbi:hypothetical protein B0H11DRAFT_2263126 [Mycena galericulata]|nr:hypothetical protein B0H11DRAFT_2263126 [Mycena galericulata]